MKSISERQETAMASTGYVRFIIVSGARTGSHMLAQALNSSPRITCLGEVFNSQLDFIQYGVDGDDGSSAQDMALRERDPGQFLEVRIFCRYPQEIRAVGFKLHYTHSLGFPGLRAWLVDEQGIRIVHLRRRNILRMMVSLKMAEATGLWVERPQLTPAMVLGAPRHPLRAATRLLRLLWRAKSTWGVPSRPPVCA